MALFLQKNLIVLLEIFLNDHFLVKGDRNWIDVLQTKTKQYNRIHSSTKLTPIQVSFRRNEGFVNKNLVEKRKKLSPKFQLNKLIRSVKQNILKRR